MISDELKAKILRGGGYKRREIELAGIKWKKGWRSNLLSGMTKDERKQTWAPSVPLVLPESGYIYRRSKTGKYHLIVGGRLLCRRSPNQQKQVTSSEKPDMPFCTICESLSVRDAGNDRPDKYIENGFYQSWEWKRLRYETLKQFGAKCMCCGSENRIVVDHIKPRKLYPELALDGGNLQVLCNDCNQGKAQWDETDWRPTEDNVELEIVASARAALD